MKLNPDSIFTEIELELHRQEVKWGVQDHSVIVWLAILAEEFGEAAKEVNELYFKRQLNIEFLRTELIQTAAVVVAMLDSLNRNGG